MDGWRAQTEGVKLEEDVVRWNGLVDGWLLMFSAGRERETGEEKAESGCA